MFKVKPEKINWSRNVLKASDEVVFAVSTFFISLFLMYVLVFITACILDFYKALMFVSPVIFVSSMALFFYQIEKRHTFLADFPKGKPVARRVFVFILLLSPINWFFILVSRFRMQVSRPGWENWYEEKMQRQREAERERQEAVRPELQEDEQNRDGRNVVIDEQARLREQFEVSQQTFPVYNNSPGVSREVYVGMVSRCGIEYALERQSVLTCDIDELGNEIRMLQAQLNEKRAELRNVKESIEVLEGENSADDFEKDFEKLLKLPCVLGVHVENDNVVFVVRCQIEVNAKKYDLGDWYVWVNAGYCTIQTKLIRDGRRPDVGRRIHPPHIEANGTFCFGENSNNHRFLIQQGRLFEALTLAFQNLCETLPGHERAMAEVYKEIKP